MRPPRVRRSALNTARVRTGQRLSGSFRIDRASDTPAKSDLVPRLCARGSSGGRNPSGTIRARVFVLHLHPYFQDRPADAIALALYQLVLVNYGDFASPVEAESFGAAVLGMDRETYYRRVCQLADELAAAQGIGGAEEAPGGA